MQWTGPGSGAREQIIGQKWLTRCSQAGYTSITSMAAYRALGYPGKNMRGCAVSYAMRDADIQTEFGADVVITAQGIYGGVEEDVAYPAGVLDENLFLPDEPWSKRLVNIVMFGRVEAVYCKAPATVDQTLLTLSNVNDSGICANFGIAEYTSNRRLQGVGTLTAGGGAFSLVADAATIDWTNPDNAPGVDVMSATGLGAGSGGVPNARSGIVGICKYGAGINGGYPGAAAEYVTAARRQDIVMCLGTSVGRI